MNSDTLGSFALLFVTVIYGLMILNLGNRLRQHARTIETLQDAILIMQKETLKRQQSVRIIEGSNAVYGKGE